jgi:hypothetical protein
VPGGRKKRDVHDIWEYGANLLWTRKSLRLGGGYTFKGERHDDEAFQDGDQDETIIDFLIGWQVSRQVNVGYTYKRERTELINQSDEEAEWETTENIMVDWLLPILKRPQLTYSAGLEKETTDEEEGDWELVHTISLSDGWDISSPYANLNFFANASYQFERDEEEDDVNFTYSLGLEHELGRTANQRLQLSREPVETCGSTTDTDSTTINYVFQKKDLFIYHLDLVLRVGYELAKPTSGETEKIWTYGTDLTYTRQVTRKLTRIWSYMYDCEDSSLQDEVLDEHRVTLSYLYTF